MIILVLDSEAKATKVNRNWNDVRRKCFLHSTGSEKWSNWPEATQLIRNISRRVCLNPRQLSSESEVPPRSQAWLINPPTHRSPSAPPAGRGKRLRGRKPGPWLHIRVTWAASALSCPGRLLDQRQPGLRKGVQPWGEGREAGVPGAPCPAAAASIPWELSRDTQEPAPALHGCSWDVARSVLPGGRSLREGPASLAA